jgi:hypothetical protein
VQVQVLPPPADFDFNQPTMWGDGGGFSLPICCYYTKAIPNCSCIVSTRNVQVQRLVSEMRLFFFFTKMTMMMMMRV